MLEMIFVVLGVIGCIASWYTLHQYKDNSGFVELCTNQKIVVGGIIATLVIAAIAVYFGWLYYAVICVVSIPLDFFVKRAIFAR